MQVRGLRNEADIRELLVAHDRAWRAAYGGLLPQAAIDEVAAAEPSEERVRSHHARLNALEEGRVFVAEDDGGTVRGYALFRWPEEETKETVRDDEAELKELYVDPDYWGRGFGTALLEAGLDRLPYDVDSVALETLEGNEVASGFYEDRGFEAAGTATFTLDGEAYPTHVYRKRL